MITSFKKKKILVTGYSSGIGNCLIKKYISLGAKVYSTSTKSEFKKYSKNNNLIFENL